MATGSYRLTAVLAFLLVAGTTAAGWQGGHPSGRQGLPEWETEGSSNGQWDSVEPSRLLSEPLPPDAGLDSPDAEPKTPDVRIVPARTGSETPDAGSDGPGGWADGPDVRIIPARTGSDSPDAEPGAPK